MSFVNILGGLRRGWQPWSPVCLHAAGLRAFAAAPDGHSGDDSAATLPVVPGPPISDAAAHNKPRRYFQLIGDPRTGVADDTTQDLFGDIQVEHIWHQQSNLVNWFRYTAHGDQLPHMYMDARLSDHSKNLMYLLRLKDPQRWSVEALAAKFRIRRQRVLAILAHKELEAAGIEQGQLLPGPLRVYATSVHLPDVHLDAASGEPLDLTDLVRSAPRPAAPGAAAAAGRPGEAVTGGPGGLGSLADFMQDEGGEATGGAGAGGSALSALQAASSDAAADLGCALPAAAAAAQRLQLQLLQLLQRCEFDPARLREQLLSEVDRAQAYYRDHVAGTALEAALVEAGVQPAGATASDVPEGEGGEAAAAAAPVWLDFARQRALVEELVAALAPVLAVADDEQQAAVVQLTRQLQAGVAAAAQASQEAAAGADGGGTLGAEVGESGGVVGDAGGGADAGTAAAGGAGGAAAAAAQQALAELQALVEGAAPPHLARAFNRLPPDERRLLLQLVPAARYALNMRGVDIRAASSASSEVPTAPIAASASTPPPLPEWPGQVPRLVDVFGFREVPAQQLDALVAAVGKLEAAAGELAASAPVRAALAAGGGADASSIALGTGTGAAEVDLLRGQLSVYQHLNCLYDKVVDEQAAAAAGGKLPPLPAAQQRRMLQLLRQLDPNAQEKVMYWESWAKEVERGNLAKARRLRESICRVVEAMDAEARGGAPPEFPDLPRSKARKQDAVRERISWDLAAAWMDAEVVGRRYHRGSGERHVTRPASYPHFEGYTLEEFDAIRESELSALARLTAEREDDMQWREFREKLLYNLGVAGSNLWVTKGRARPQRPAGGWSYVVHPLGSRAAAAAGQLPGPYVAPPRGAQRPLNEDEAYLQRRRTPKPRKRWYYSHRQPRSLQG